MNYMSNLLELIKFNYVNQGKFQDINFYIEMNKIKKVDIMDIRIFILKKKIDLLDYITQ
jgi:hypothetical protein